MEKKLRAPDTIEDAVVQAKALLGEGAIAHALDVSGSLIVKWSDHDDKAHRIGCHQALAVDLLLVEAGHVPVFVALFEAQRPGPVVVQEKADPVQLAMQATTDTAVLMEDVARAAARGEIAPAAVLQLRNEIARVQGDLAKLRRSLEKHAPLPEPAPIPDRTDSWAVVKTTMGRNHKTRQVAGKRRKR